MVFSVDVQKQKTESNVVGPHIFFLDTGINERWRRLAVHRIQWRLHREHHKHFACPLCIVIATEFVNDHFRRVEHGGSSPWAHNSIKIKTKLLKDGNIGSDN